MSVQQPTASFCRVHESVGLTVAQVRSQNQIMATFLKRELGNVHEARFVGLTALDRLLEAVGPEAAWE